MFKVDFIGKSWVEDCNNRRVRFINAKCNICNNEYKARYHNAVTRGRTVCSNCRGVSTSRYKGGVIKHPLYTTWSLIKRRVDNTSVKKIGGDLKYYNGINLCEEWMDFNNFSTWAINNGWEKGLSVDRINPNGDYSPDNCRIVNQSVQNANKKTRADNSTGYTGICLSGRENQPYLVRVSFENKTLFQKRFKTIEDAISARNKFIKDNNLPHYI